MRFKRRRLLYKLRKNIISQKKELIRCGFRLAFRYRKGYVLEQIKVYYCYRILYKLFLIDYKDIPGLKSVWFRGCYRGFSSLLLNTKNSQRFRIERSLLLLKLCRDMWFFRHDLYSGAGFSPIMESSGWIVKLLDKLDNQRLYQELIWEIIFESPDVGVTQVDTSWVPWKPESWKALPEYLWKEIDSSFLYNVTNLRRFYKFWVLGGENAYFLQFRILCDLPISRIFVKNINRSVWYLKVLFLRLLNYPIVLQYNQLTLILLLSKIGYTNRVPSEIFETFKTTWQANPIAADMITIVLNLNSILSITRYGVPMTEFLIKRVWKFLIIKRLAFNYLLRYNLMVENQYIFLKLLNRRF